MTGGRFRPLIRAARAVAVTLAFALLVVAAMAWLTGFFEPKVEAVSAGAPRRPVGDAPVVEAALVRLPRVESAVGTIRAVHETTVASELLGRLVAVPVEAGRRVAEGDVLARLHDEELAARLRQAEAAVESARARREDARILFTRVRSAFDQEAATQTEVERASAALDAAEAEVRRAEEARREAAEALEDTVVRSPIDGVVVDKHVEAGDTVTPGQRLVTLYDPERMQLVAGVRESLTRQLAVGGTVSVRIDALGRTCEGRVSEIVPQAAAESRTFTVKVTGPCPPGVYSGMFGRLLIPLDEEAVLAIPEAAVRRVGQLDLVDVADGPWRRRRLIEVGRRLGDGDVEVLAGLRPGERVVLPAAPPPAGTDGP